MRATALMLLLCSCAHRVCGVLDAEEIAAFHRSHELSNGANESSVEGLAVDGFLVCIEGGKAQIQNHRTEPERAHDAE